MVVGVDVRMSSCESYVDSYPRRPKALHLDDKKDIIVGAVGNIGLVDLLRQILSEYNKKDLYAIDRPFVVKYIVPALMTGARDYNMTDKEGKTFEYHQGCELIDPEAKLGVAIGSEFAICTFTKVQLAR